MSDTATRNLTDKATYERLEKDVTAVKNDIAALTDQITDALNSFAGTATKQARPFLPHCSDIVIVGRLRLIEGSPFTGLDNFAWLRFSADHHAGPILHTSETPALARTTVCTSCGRSFLPERSTAKFCSGACRQHFYRGRVSVTLA